MDEATIYGIIAGVLSLITLVLMIIWYTTSPNPDAKSLAEANMGVYPTVTRLSPLGGDLKQMKLCDYYLASSAYSVFPGNSPTDYISDSVIPPVVKAGARLIELDVYGDGNIPVVGLKNENLGYDYAQNSVSLENCFRAIANTAFNSVETPLSSDPFVLSLMFHTDNTLVMNAAAQLVKDVLGRFLLDQEYAFQRKNLAQEPIDNLKGKLIIVSGGNVKNTKFDELVNLSWSTSHLRRLTYMQASQPYDHEELMNLNRTSICMVVPDPNPDLKNNNPTILFSYGCQWNLMNYGSVDSMMELNIEKFQRGSLVLKPIELRDNPIEAKTPTLPDTSKSFQPMSHTSPIYDKGKNGDNSLVV